MIDRTTIEERIEALKQQREEVVKQANEQLIAIAGALSFADSLLEQPQPGTDTTPNAPADPPPSL